MRGKKGLDYAILLFVVVAIGLGTLYLEMTNKIGELHKQIGDSQSPILKVDPQISQINAFVSSAARYSIEKTRTNLASPVAQGFTDACPTLNTVSSPTTIQTPDLQSAINKQFNLEMDKYLDAYKNTARIEIPKDNYELYITTEEITGVAIKPANIALKGMTGREIGTINYKPSFKIKYKHELNAYPESLNTITYVAKNCIKTEKPKECADTYASSMTGWTWKEEAGKIVFTIPHGTATTCYSLIIPPKTTTPIT